LYEVVVVVCEVGFDVLVFIDYDSMVGWDVVGWVVCELGVWFVFGMELLCGIDGISVYLLSYLYDLDDEYLCVEVDVVCCSWWY